MKGCKTIPAFAAALLLAVFLAGCGAQNAGGAEAAGQTAGADAAALVADIPTIQAFTQDAVDETDLQTILTAGVNAPSAMNNQPWHFSVVTDPDVLQ